MSGTTNTGSGYAGSISMVGTVVSTAANIWSSINNGKIKAIQMETQALNAEQQIRNSQSANKLDNMDSIDKLSTLDTQYQAQLAQLSDNYAQVTESQVMANSGQGRTLDSLDRIQNADKLDLNKDKQLSLLNKQSAEASIKGERDVKRIQRYGSEAQMTANAGIAREDGNIARYKANIDASNSLLKGITTLAQNNVPKKDKKGN